MKGKERSPVKKRSRILDEIRERGGHPTSKKVVALSATSSSNGNSSAINNASSRRSLPGDKRDVRDLEGHNASSRTGSSYDYGSNSCGNNSNKQHSSPDIGADSARVNSRGDSRQPSSTESEYKTLKISELGSQLNDEEIEDGLFHEFKKFGDVSVKISRANNERVAFVNFRRPDDAKSARHARGKLSLYDRILRVEPVYMNRRRSRSPVSKDNFYSGHRNLPPQRPLSPTGLGYRDYRLQQLALGRLPPPPPPPHLRDLERDREFAIYDARNRPSFVPECAVFREDDLLLPEDDQRANRTLFLGNLDITVTESDLRRAFDRFGVITEVDIKRTVRGQNSTYGFLKFENLDMAHRAKLAMSGKVVGHNPIKIGYGKPTPTTRLWVGGLGHWVPVAALAREFDRFGTIRTIDYRKGDSWAYIQYESLDAAQAACTHMRGFPLGGPDRRLRVDFAEAEHRYQQQYMHGLPLPPYDFPPEPFAHRAAPDPMRGRERSPPGPLHFRDRDFYSGSEWPDLGVRGPGFDPLDHVDRRSRDAWSEERELGRKRRPVEDGRRPDRSPDATADYLRRRRGNSPDRSPGRHSDPERHPRPGGGPSPICERQGSLDRGPGGNNSSSSKRRRSTPSPAEPDKARRRKASGPSRSPSKKDPAASPPPPQTKQGTGAERLSRVWQGALLLKNSSFPTAMHLLEGDPSLASSLLSRGPRGAEPASQLKISQRLRLDQPKLDEVSRRLKAAGPGGYAALLAVPAATEDASSSTERPLKNLVSYLKQKEAAGVISLPVGGRDKVHAGVLHAFPPCGFSQRFLDASSKAFAKSEEDYLVMVIIRGAS